MTALLDHVVDDVSDHMDAILANFKSGAKITVLVRRPHDPDGDFCLTSDEFDEILAMVERRKIAVGK